MTIKPRSFQVLIPLLVLGGLLLCSPPARAHRIKLFAAAQGEMISGYAYFPGGAALPDAAIKIYAPTGETLGQVTTDAQGGFSFQAVKHVDHLLVLDPGDGHRAEFTITAAELPNAPGSPSRPPTIAPSTTPQMTPAPAPPPVDNQLEAAVGRAMAGQIAALRQDLQQLDERLRLQDIAGAIGYFIGLAGLTLYFKGRRPGH